VKYLVDFFIIVNHKMDTLMMIINFENSINLQFKKLQGNFLKLVEFEFSIYKIILYFIIFGFLYAQNHYQLFFFFIEFLTHLS
jgi:hypothetical protein